MNPAEPTPPSTFDLAFTVLALAMIALAAGMGIGDFGPGAAVNDWQDSLMGGRHFPFFTVMMLSLAFVIPVFVIKAVVVRMRAK